jgi:hypothetical protein
MAKEKKGLKKKLLSDEEEQDPYERSKKSKKSKSDKKSKSKRGGKGGIPICGVLSLRYYIKKIFR